jgi:prevent-host-death family protein
MVPFTEARARLTELLDDANDRHEHVVITRNGRPAAVVLSSEEYEALAETLEVLDDDDALAALRESEADVRAGRVYSLDEVRRELGLDVDGTELDVLAGAERALSDPSLRTVLTELDDKEAGQLEAVLAGHGLHLRERFRSEKRNLGPDGSDAPQPPAYGLFTRGGAT